MLDIRLLVDSVLLSVILNVSPVGSCQLTVSDEKSAVAMMGAPWAGQESLFSHCFQTSLFAFGLPAHLQPLQNVIPALGQLPLS